MVSKKFKPGRKVYYISSLSNTKVTGIVAPFDLVEATIPRELPYGRRYFRVWGFWGGNTYLSSVLKDKVRYYKEDTHGQ